MTLEIHPAASSAECRHIIEIGRAAWGASDAATVPDHLLWTIAKESGIVLLAWVDRQAVGFCFSFLARTPDGALKQHSHMAGVLPQYQQQGIGSALKWAQRDAALAMGINLITWTFDPLQARNGVFNLRKLGAISTVYQRDLYGRLTDHYNAGMPSDRLEARWHLNASRVVTRAAGRTPARITGWRAANSAEVRAGVPQPTGIDLTVFGRAPTLGVLIPAHFPRLKAADLPLALAWRTHTRTIFETAFANGYSAVDVYRYDDALVVYVLEQGGSR